MKRTNGNPPCWLMLFIIMAFILLAVASQAQAAGPVVTDMTKCSISWDATPTATDYKLFLGTALAVETKATTVPCTALNITADGDYSVQLQARNAAGVSPKTAQFPFTVAILKSPPIPTGLRLEQ